MDSCDIYSVIKAFSRRCYFFLPRALECPNPWFLQSILGTLKPHLKIVHPLFYINLEYKLILVVFNWYVVPEVMWIQFIGKG